MKLTPNIPSSSMTMWSLICRVINGFISFGSQTATGYQPDNMDGAWLTAAFTVAPNTDQTFNHVLGRPPIGYLVMSKAAPHDVYTGSVAATNTQITLRSTITPVTDVLFLV